MKKELTRLTVDIPAELHRRAKVYAAETGNDLRVVVEAALRLWLLKAERGRSSFHQMSPEVGRRLQSLKSKKGGGR